MAGRPAAFQLSPRGRRVGLMGGSFNPAHEGHLHVSRLALERLRLDAVWWLVSPQNPLKPAAGMAPFEERFASAQAAAKAEPRIVVSDLELRLGTRFAVDTVALLKRRFPAVRFVWIMGADNMIQVRKWRKWRAIFRALPIAVFARPSYSWRARSSRAARRFANAEVSESRARSLVDVRPPAWTYLETRPKALSATRIRARRRAPAGA
jgi:nicotinate-nucleotide adenylyltransferase